MKKIYLLAALIVSAIAAFAQTNVNVGGGYFGHTATYPGLVAELELEKMFTENVSLPFRTNLGFYSHPRYHTGVFLDVNIGFRKYFKSGLFLEESVGVGILEAFLSSDDVFEVNEAGDVSDGSRALPPDLIPSLTLGLGYNLSPGTGKQNLVWLRPKLFWQYPHKTTSTYNLAMQVGFTHTIRSK